MDTNVEPEKKAKRSNIQCNLDVLLKSLKILPVVNSCCFCIDLHCGAVMSCITITYYNMLVFDRTVELSVHGYHHSGTPLPVIQAVLAYASCVFALFSFLFCVISSFIFCIHYMESKWGLYAIFFVMLVLIFDTIWVILTIGRTFYGGAGFCIHMKSWFNCSELINDGGRCLPPFSGRKLGELCTRENQCDAGLVCAEILPGEMRVCKPPSGERKQYNEDCNASSECDITRGLCCIMQRRHRQKPRKSCGYFKEPLVCIGPVATDQIREFVQHTAGEKRVGVYRLH